ncbi:unnamed protein product [Linum trigynum]|uniref:Uncharacterized protein n=1 Tax=Linum trigynum TaxID=586398 RepID=A0AAV2DIP0_9ROSI
MANLRVGGQRGREMTDWRAGGRRGRWLLLPAVTGLDPGKVTGDRAGLSGCRAGSRGSMVWPSGLDGGDGGGWLVVVTGEGREGSRSTKEKENRVWGGLG